MKTLRKGDKGTVVRTLQGKLTLVGFPLDLDGSFGSNTDKAVRNFQRQHKLQIDGKAGPKTYGALEVAIKSKKKAISIQKIRKGSQGSLVRTLQELLSAEGYPIIPLSDYFGEKTDKTVRYFQRKNKLLSDGVVGPVTWHALGVTGNSKVKPVNSLNRIVASIGGIGACAAQKASNAPKSNQSAIPINKIHISTKGLSFLYTREAKPNCSNILHWPGKDSGVTLGPGYDMKGRKEPDICSDLKKILDQSQSKLAEKIAKGAGLSGLKAKKFCEANKNLVKLTNKQEFELLKLIVPHYENQVKKRVTVALMPHEFDALVSFAYNHGYLWPSIAKHINNGNVNLAMTRLKDGNKSGGQVDKGLSNRRALEIALYTLGDYGKLRIV